MLDLTNIVKNKELPNEINVYDPNSIVLINGAKREEYTKEQIEEIMKYKEKDVIYELYAVANHSGTVSGGHYYCYAKNFNNK